MYVFRDQPWSRPQTALGRRTAAQLIWGSVVVVVIIIIVIFGAAAVIVAVVLLLWRFNELQNAVHQVVFGFG